MSRSLAVAWGTLGISIAVLAMKAGAYWVTGSVALYSDALETVISVVAAAGALVNVWFAEQPAYASDPLGRARGEHINVVVKDAIVLVTGIVAGRGAWLGWQHPHAPDRPLLGILLNSAAGVINLVWALLLVRCGRAWRSPTLMAIGRYVMIGIWTSGAVLVGFALVPLKGWLWLDPAVATLVALGILWTGYGMVRQSVGDAR